mmetsp:Transcript_10376/g.9380  ORF Transcript_10376/g.9380 Transcript_10376/m.9380 type:complete len:136 (-) Transcript_10376:176-583(-)
MADEKEDLNQAKDLLKQLEGQASSGNHLGVLQTISKSPPNCKDAELQKKIAIPVVTALSKLKRTNMDSCLKQMDEKGRETILQYVFYGFQTMPKSSTEFLNWHQAIVKQDGIGAIVRVATNIKRNILVSADSTTV